MALLDEMIECCRQHNMPEAQAYFTHHLFLNLCEVDKLWDVSWHHNVDLNILFCKAKRSQIGPEMPYIPLSSNAVVSPKSIQNYQDTLNYNQITFAIGDSDSSLMYYKVTNDLLKPEITSAEDKKGGQLDVLLRNKKKLYMQALENQSETS